MVVDAIEIVVMTKHVFGRVAGERGIVVVEAEIVPLAIERPRVEFRPVPDERIAGKDVFGVAARPVGGVHPLVVGLFERRGVEPRDRRLEVGAVGRKAHFDRPERAVHPVIGREEATRRAVRIRAREVIDRRGDRGLMTDEPEVEFDAARRPRAAHGDVAELHDGVVVDKVLAVHLVVRVPDLAADVGENIDPDVPVFKAHDLPRLCRALLRIAVVAAVGVDLRVGVRG